MSDDPLSGLNRAIIAVVALLVAFLALALILVAWGASDGAIGQVEDFGGYLRDHNNNAAKTIVTLLGAIVALLMASLIIVEVTPAPTQKMRLRNVKSGDAVLTTAEIAARIEEEARDVEHVAGCTAVVAAKGQKLTVLLDLEVDGAADLARTADEACRRADALVTQRMGLTLAERPRARMHYRELRLKNGAPAPATGWERPGDRSPDEAAHSDATEEARAQGEGI